MPTVSRSGPERPARQEIAMASAVFQAPLDTAPAGTRNAIGNVAAGAGTGTGIGGGGGAGAGAAKPSAPTPPRRDRAGIPQQFWMAVLPPLCGLGLLLVLW